MLRRRPFCSRTGNGPERRRARSGTSGSGTFTLPGCLTGTDCVTVVVIRGTPSPPSKALIRTVLVPHSRLTERARDAKPAMDASVRSNSHPPGDPDARGAAGSDDRTARRRAPACRAEFAAGGVVFEQGDSGDRFYVVESRRADVIRHGRLVDTRSGRRTRRGCPARRHSSRGHRFVRAPTWPCA